MTKSCVCYITNVSYLYPTFVSALQARRQSSPSKADIVIFGLDLDSVTQDCFGPACEAEGICLLAPPSSTFEGIPVLMARLFLDRILPTVYDTFLYIDGDTQICGSLDPLLNTQIPEGQFFATADPMEFSVTDSIVGDQVASQHFLSLGIKQNTSRGYFNSGVLWVDRGGWRQIESDALKAYQEKSDYKFLDQDILNIVAGNKHIPMSLKWNFPIFMKNAGVEHLVKPHIYHFMSNPKPWQGAFAPWGLNATRAYKNASNKYPSLIAYRDNLSLKIYIKYYLQQEYKRADEILNWRFSKKRKNIMSYENRLASSPI